MGTLKKRMAAFLVMVMAIAASIGFALQAPAPAYADDENFGLVNWIEPKGDGSVIWIGEHWMTNNGWNNSNRESQWRIIGENDSSWLLISNSLIADNTYTNNGAVSWERAQELCGALLSHFTVVEQAAIPTTDKNEPAGHYYRNREYTGDLYDFAPQSVQAQLFMLSVEEAETYLGSSIARQPGPWWLRSPVHFPGSGNINNNLRGYVQGDGSFYYSDINNIRLCSWMRPAFQIDRSKVLFVSNAVDGKRSIVGADALGSFGEPTTSEWKMTLKDPSRSDFTVTKVRAAGNGFTVTYTGAKTGTDEFISAIVKDSSGNITQYGRIAEASDASGEVVIATDGKLGEGDTLYVFNEHCYGDKKSDCASELREVLTPQSISVNVGAGHEPAAEDLASVLETFVGTELPAGTEVSYEGETVRIDFPLFWDVTNGEIAEILTAALAEDTVKETYGGDHNLRTIGYQPVYESADAYTSDLAANNDLPLEDETFYVVWDKLIGTVTVTVSDEPKCGFKVTGSRPETQNPRPSFGVLGDGIDIDESTCYWWTAPSAQEGVGELFSGEVRFGNALYARADLKAKYGYYFGEGTVYTFNGSDPDDALKTDPELVLAGTISVAEHDWSEWTVTVEPTETTEGEKTRVCACCGEIETEVIPALTPDPGPDDPTPDDPDPDDPAPDPKPDPAPAPGSDPNQMGADGTPVGPGASAAAADKAITTMKKDADPKGSVFGKLKLRSTKQGKTSIKLKWSKVSGAAKYVVYGNKCGKTSKPKKLATTTGASKTLKKVAGKKVKKGTYYKFIVVALDRKGNVVSTSKLIHVATKGGKVGNDKKVTVPKQALSKAKKLKKGKSLKLGAKAAPQSKKLKVKRHVKLRYESTNAKVATVSSKGTVKARSKGTCYVYAYAQDGVYKKVKVTVK